MRTNNTPSWVNTWFAMVRRMPLFGTKRRATSSSTSAQRVSINGTLRHQRPSRRRPRCLGCFYKLCTPPVGSPTGRVPVTELALCVIEHGGLFPARPAGLNAKAAIHYFRLTTPVNVPPFAPVGAARLFCNGCYWFGLLVSVALGAWRCGLP